MRAWWDRLPGPPVARALLAGAILIIALMLLFFVFEQAGDLLDSGGVIGS